MRTLNVKRAVVFLVAVIVVAGSTHLLHSYQLHRKSSSFKTQAEAAWNDNPRRYFGRRELMRAYLVLAPQDYEAREELGFWYAASGRFGDASTTLEELVRALEKQNPPDVPTIQRVRREIDRFRHGPGTMHGCRLSLGDPQEGTARRRGRLEQAGEVQGYAGAGGRRGHRELFRSDPPETGPRRHLVQQGDGLAFSSRAEIGGSREVHGRDDRRPRQTPNRPRAPRLWPVARGTGENTTRP